MITTPVAASAAVFPRFCIRNVYVNVPFSVTGTGLTDFVIVRSGPLTAFTVSFTVTGVTPAPEIVAVFVMEASAASGA